MTHRILQGCVFDRLPEIEPGSIDCAMTSPPYWMLRSYLPKGHALKHLELGSEKTPAEYVANQVRVASLVREALADHACYFINIGDSYSNESAGGPQGATGQRADRRFTAAGSGGSAQRAAVYDTGGIELEDSQYRDSSSQSLCDACLALAQNKVRTDSLPASTPLSSPASSIPARKAKRRGRSANSDPSLLDYRSASAIQDREPIEGRASAASPVPSLSASSDESLRQPLAGNCQADSPVVSSIPSALGSCSESSLASDDIRRAEAASSGCTDDTASPSGPRPRRNRCTSKPSPACSDKDGSGLLHDESSIGNRRICSECGQSFQSLRTDIDKPNPIVRQCSRNEIPSGNLCLIPQRLMIALQDDGWIVRSVIVWHKPAPMPASITGWRWMKCRVRTKAQNAIPSNKFGTDHRELNSKPSFNKDFQSAEWIDCPGCKKCASNAGLVLRKGSWRPTSSYEPILMLAKTAGYFADGEPVKTPASAATVSRDQYTRVLDDPDEQFAVRHDHESLCDAGANARDVQRWAAEPLSEKHYAAYPTALVQWCLRAGTSAKGYCPMCGAPWVRIVEKEESAGKLDYNGKHLDTDPQGSGRRLLAGVRAAREAGGDHDNPFAETRTIGWSPSCRCIGADTVDPRPGRVLDPFAGSGRTGIACSRLGLDFTGIELNPDYAKMAERLIREESPLFATASE